MIDLHCHLLPGIDDGPADMEGTIALARAQVHAGVGVVACTPHVTWELPNRAADIATGIDVVRAALAEAGVELELAMGGEVGLTYAIDLDDDELRALCLGDGPWVLLEAPLGVSVGIEQAVTHVAMRGHRILLAHPERAPAFQRDPDALRRLVDGAGVLTQVTASSLTGAFGSPVQRFAERLMREGLVHVIASDAHDAVRRGPGLREPMERAGFAGQVDWLTREVPAAILAGVPFPPAPVLDPASPPPRRRRWWGG